LGQVDLAAKKPVLAVRHAKSERSNAMKIVQHAIVVPVLAGNVMDMDLLFDLIVSMSCRQA
jgi:hypothetical protein